MRTAPWPAPPAALLALALACGAPSAGPSSTATGGGPTDSGASIGDDGDGDADPADDRAGAPDPRAGCQLDLQADAGQDGLIDWSETTEWDARVDAEGAALPTLYHYEDRDGDLIDELTTYDDLLCVTTTERRATVDGVETGERSARTCDSAGRLVGATYEVLVDGAWTDDGEREVTYTEDSEGRVTESLSVLRAPDGGVQSLRTVTTWSSDVPSSVELYLDVGDGELAYYAVRYDYGGDLLLDASELTLGAYFGAQSGDVAFLDEHTYDTAGRLTRRLHTDLLRGGQIDRWDWTYDAQGRLIEESIERDSDGAHSTTAYTLDAELDRPTATDHADLVTPAEDYHTDHQYSGGWPWTETALQDYLDPSRTDDTALSRAYTCD